MAKFRSGTRERENLSSDNNKTTDDLLPSQGSMDIGEVTETKGAHFFHTTPAAVETAMKNNTMNEESVIVINEDKEEWEVVSSAKKTQAKKKFVAAVAVRQSSKVQANHKSPIQGGFSVGPGNFQYSSNCLKFLIPV
jgi:hypothetical protein